MVEQSSKTLSGIAGCPSSDLCGGCDAIDVPYEQQIAQKDQEMRALFAALVSEHDAELRPIIPMDDPFHYRDKVSVPFAPGKRGPNGGRQILCGMYERGTHRIIDSAHCRIENERAHEVIQGVRSVMGKLGIAPYDERHGTGFVRHCIVRVGHESDEVLVTLVTNGAAFPRKKAFCRELVKRCPFITTIVQNVNEANTNTILGTEEHVLYGPGFILDRLCGQSFRISSQSFYQVNRSQTAVLYGTAMDLAELREDDRVLDAYCGTGTLGIIAASRGVAHVVAVDSVDAAIDDARENARHNGLSNMTFVTADAAEMLKSKGLEGNLSVALMDPPRAGASVEFLDGLARAAPRRILYISCNPSTQKRDMEHLAERGYRLRIIQPVDMFPHTRHIESIAVLDREEG